VTTFRLKRSAESDLGEVLGLVGESAAGLPVGLPPVGAAVVCGPQRGELVRQLVVDVALAAGDLVQRPADVVRQPAEQAAGLPHARVDRRRVLLHLVHVLAPVLDTDVQQPDASSTYCLSVSFRVCYCVCFICVHAAFVRIKLMMMMIRSIQVSVQLPTTAVNVTLLAL